MPPRTDTFSCCRGHDLLARYHARHPRREEGGMSERAIIMSRREERGMSERPIVMQGASVRAILAGRKTQTRRVVKPREYARLGLALHGIAARIAPDVPAAPIHVEPGVCRYGAPGDRLWVREAFAHLYREDCDGCDVPDGRCEHAYVEYRADTGASRPGGWDAAPDDAEAVRWRSPIFMPRWASRLTLEVVGIRVERVAAITEEDAAAEGCSGSPMATPREQYEALWDEINGGRAGGSWKDDPWVFAVEFRRAP